MIRTDRGALICDMWEVYQVHDLKTIPVRTLATLAAGLPQDSRIKMALTGRTIPIDTILLAAAVDRLSILLWSHTKDAKTGANRPKSVVEALTHKEGDKAVREFDSVADYEAARKKILGEYNGDKFGDGIRSGNADN